MALAIASMAIFAVSCGNNNAKKAAEATEAAAEDLREVRRVLRFPQGRC